MGSWEIKIAGIIGDPSPTISVRCGESRMAIGLNSRSRIETQQLMLHIARFKHQNILISQCNLHDGKYFSMISFD
jgi:hypothetical protein